MTDSLNKTIKNLLRRGSVGVANATKLFREQTRIGINRLTRNYKNKLNL